ncbi:MAG: 3-oxoacyl-[acyl-carrier-protein] synthase [Actinomycetota bacterium]|nr:3-oxoacyl-[acyl-carrier-protein] synthase [Actinomycetota bacterium]
MTAAAGIVGWGTAVPDARVTNADLEARLDTSDAWIVERTGIRERRIAGPNESTATLATEAATQAIKRAGLIPADIDLMIIATVTPEQPIPHTGAFVGETLGLQCGSFDMNAACAGFVYELVVGASMLGMGYEHVLLVGAETLSRIIDPEDRTTTVLFGDGAGAAVLAPMRETPGVLAWDLGCDGSAAGLLEVPAGGSRRPASAATVAGREHYLKMAGQEVFRRAVRAVVDSAALTLERAGVEASDVAWFVPHQANARIIEAAANRLGFEPERTLVNIDRFGNTSSASIPLALFEAVDDGRVRAGDLVLCSGFGAGMTWASALLRWGAR